MLTEAWVIIQENGVICERFCFLPQHNQRIPVRAASEAIRSLKRQPLKKMAERSKRENKLLEQQQLRAQREEALLYAWVEQAHREGLEKERDKAERRARKRAAKAAKQAKREKKKKTKRQGTQNNSLIGIGFELLS